MTKKLAVAVAVATMTVGCGVAVVGSRYVKSEAVVASQGANITVSVAENADLAETRLAIPAGALQQDTVITLEVGLTPLVSDQEQVSPVAVWGPSGLVFSTPATMTLPVALEATDSASDLLVLVEEADGQLLAIPVVALSEDHRTVSFQVKGFSSYQVRRRARACMADTDCRGGRVCVSGLCRRSQSDGGVAGRCSTDMDCSTSERCSMGVCVTQCAGSVEVCDGLDNDCDGAVDEGCGFSCMRDGDCAPGQACYAGVCGGGTCSADPDCAMGQVCIGGACVNHWSCRSDVDCAPNMFCNAGTCQGFDGGIDGGFDGGPGSCRIDSDCGLGLSCVSGMCVSLTDGGMCATDRDCEVGQVCDPGLRLCMWPQMCVPSVEVCDGRDNDCDGFVDEGCVDAGVDGGSDGGRPGVDGGVPPVDGGVDGGVSPVDGGVRDGGR